MWTPEHRLAADRLAFVTRAIKLMPNGRFVAAMIPSGRHGERTVGNVRESEPDLLRQGRLTQWTALPKDLPPKSTVTRYLAL